MTAEAIEIEGGVPPFVRYSNALSFRNKLARSIWGVVWLICFRPTPRLLHAWRCWILRIFGARVGKHVRCYPSAKIWAPWNLQLNDFSCLGPDVDCYCVAPITVGRHATISQYSYLCAASHDYEDPAFRLITAPIVIEPSAWVAAAAFVGMGVTIGEGAVVGARASVYKDVPAWTVVGGNPAKVLKTRRVNRR